MMDPPPTPPLHTPLTWTHYYEIITGATPPILPGGLVPFSQTGVSYSNQLPAYPTSFTLAREDDHTFYFTFPPAYIGFTGDWRFTWQVPCANAGQLCLQFARTNTPGFYQIWNPPALTGSSWGHSQIIGDTLIHFTGAANSYVYFQIVNPAANNQTIELISSGAGFEHLAASLMVQYLQ